MAEAALLSGLITAVTKKATNSLFQQIGEMWGIKGQRQKLHSLLLEIEAVLPDAEEHANSSSNSNPAMKSWLVDLESAAYDADDVMDQLHYEDLRQDAVRHGHKVGNVIRRALFSLKNPVLLRYKMSMKLKKVVKRVDGLVLQMRRFGFDPAPRVDVANRNITNSVVESEVVGRDEDKNKVVQLLLERCESDDLKVVPIVGMGGLGKTTLAKLVYNDPSVKEYFKLPLWVCVSKEFDIGHIANSIIQLVEEKSELPIDNNYELLQRRLHQVLSKKRYLLVLDNVWNENKNDWERLKAMLNRGDSGSAIIVTTRSKQVANIMGTVLSYNLDGLGDKEAWTLFRKRAFSQGVEESKDKVQIGKNMVQKCGGLPLAINALGSLMSFKFEVREWLALQESRIWEQRPVNEQVLPVLRLSYDDLPSYMKQCFAFCAVYPKNYEMDKEKLIQFWMANGFIPSDGSINLEMEGNNIFNELAWRSFFHEVGQGGIVSLRGWIGENLMSSLESQRREGHCSEIKCKMHDLMHDLAQLIMGAKCLSTSEVSTQQNQPMINVRHISVRTPPIDINKAIDYFPSIRSLISFDRYGSNSVKNIGVRKSNSLRILELNVEPINKTIFSVRKMKHLRYLELSVAQITSLPEAISTLYLLQTLRLSNCRSLIKLPEGMRYMCNLRHLYISKHCYNLQNMPKDLGQLKQLQILTTYIVGTDVGTDIKELSDLNDLQGQLHLYNLRKIKHHADAGKANLMAKQNLDNLTLHWGMPKEEKSSALQVLHHNPFEVLDALKPCNKLKVLRIKEYTSKDFPVWMTEYQMLENLIELYLIACRECEIIPQILEKLPFLRILKLKYLDNLKHLCTSASTSSEGSEGTRVAFPSLKRLVLSKMAKLCSWCDGEVGNKSSLIFPKLKTLQVTNCPNLTAMPTVPSLRSMSVEGNKTLSCFAARLTTLHDLSLDGDGENESLSFQPGESLKQLFLGQYNRIVPINANDGEGSITLTECRMLRLWKVSNIPSNESLWFWKCFISLENLQIILCDSFIHWPDEEFRSLNCLRSIRVFNCSKFLGKQRDQLPVGTSNTEVLLPKLEYLYIEKCPNLVEIPECSASIQRMSICDCPELQCLPEWLGSMIALKELKIEECRSLNSLPPSIGNLASLVDLSIIDCPNLADLPTNMERLIALEVLSIRKCPNIEVLPEGMEGLKALVLLTIKECPKIKVLPEGLLQQLQNLNELWIEGCPHLEKHFRKNGRYRPLTSKIRVTKFGEERRFSILNDLALTVPSCKITCFSTRS